MVDGIEIEIWSQPKPNCSVPDFPLWSSNGSVGFSGVSGIQRYQWDATVGFQDAGNLFGSAGFSGISGMLRSVFRMLVIYSVQRDSAVSVGCYS